MASDGQTTEGNGNGKRANAPYVAILRRVEINGELKILPLTMTTPRVNFVGCSVKDVIFDSMHWKIRRLLLLHKSTLTNTIEVSETSLERVTSTLLRRLVTMNTLPPHGNDSNSSLKHCPTCPEDNQWYPATTEFFHLNRRSKDKLNRLCKKCNTAHAARYKQEKRKNKPPKPSSHPLPFEGNLKASKRGEKACLTCLRERAKRRYHKNPEKIVA